MNQRMSRISAIVVAGIVTAATAALLVTAGGARGSASVAQYEYGAPAPGAPPGLVGTARSGSALTASTGTWSSASTITYVYRWLRCDANGKNCGQLDGATANTYQLADADVGHRVVVQVFATNAVGTTVQGSQPSAVVAAEPATTSVLARDVALPNRLVIDKIAYSQNPIRSRLNPTQIRVHIAANGGKSVQSALVYVLGVPYNRIANVPEVATDSLGWATLSLSPLRSFPRTGYLVLFIRARVQGQDSLAGTSTRRLVQASIGAPNGS